MVIEVRAEKTMNLTPSNPKLYCHCDKIVILTNKADGDGSEVHNVATVIADNLDHEDGRSSNANTLT